MKFSLIYINLIDLEFKKKNQIRSVSIVLKICLTIELLRLPFYFYVNGLMLEYAHCWAGKCLKYSFVMSSISPFTYY